MKKPGAMQAPKSRFDLVGGHVALDFVNTIGNRLDPKLRRDDLATTGNFTDWVAAVGLGPEPMQAPIQASDLDEVRRARETLYALFAAVIAHTPPDAESVVALNRMLGDIGAKRQLSAYGAGLRWTWRDGTGASEIVLFTILSQAAELLSSEAAGKIRQCQGDGCGWVFLDRARSGHRLWCSMRDCGNKARPGGIISASRRPAVQGK